MSEGFQGALKLRTRDAKKLQSLGQLYPVWSTRSLNFYQKFTILKQHIIFLKFIGELHYITAIYI